MIRRLVRAGMWLVVVIRGRLISVLGRLEIVLRRLVAVLECLVAVVRLDTLGSLLVVGRHRLVARRGALCLIVRRAGAGCLTGTNGGKTLVRALVTVLCGRSVPGSGLVEIFNCADAHLQETRVSVPCQTCIREQELHTSLK